MQKICLLIPTLQQGGAERVVSKLSKLLNRNYNVTIVVFDSSNIFYDVECNLISLDVKPTSNFFSKLIDVINRLVKFSNVVKQERFDACLSFGESANYINALSLGTHRKYISLRGYGTILRMKKRKKISQLLINRSDGIFCVSKKIEEELKTSFIINISTYVIYNNAPSLIEFQRDKLSKNDSEFVFVTCGTLKKEKGYIYLLHAFKLLEDINSKLIIIGPDGDDSDNIKNEILKLDLSNRVRLTGKIKDLYEIYKNCDCFVLSSIQEGFPNVLIEAMSFCLPVISTNCPTGPWEILSDENYSKIDKIKFLEYGIISPDITTNESNGVTQLYKAMKEIMTNEKLRFEYRFNSYEGSKRFNDNKVLKQYIEMLGE